MVRVSVNVTDYQALHAMAGDLVAPSAARNFPDGGDEALKAVLRVCKRLFAALDPTQLAQPVFVFSHASPGDVPEEELQMGYPITNLAELADLRDTGFALAIDWFTNEIRVVPGKPLADLDDLRSRGVVFIHNQGNEQLLIGDDTLPLRRLFPGPQSFFSIPNYATLDDALWNYRRSVVRHSECKILEEIWHDDRRLFLKAGPEDGIQESLVAYLRTTLPGDVEVLREQNVNKTEPVDVRVIFHYTNRVALVELKWLGKSLDEDGNVTATHWAGRAVKGACQLVHYLDEFNRSTSSSVTRGYLVILDARRRNLSSDSVSVTLEDGMHYASDEIDFPPEYLRRPDFAEPLRMFAEPVCS